jgi:hypothetical protein
MFRLAANPAAAPLLSLCTMEKANWRLPTCNSGGEQRSSWDVPGHTKVVAVAANLLRQDPDEDFGLTCVRRVGSRRMLGYRFGALPAPCGNSLFCFGCAALRVTVSLQILFRMYTGTIFPEPP